MPFIKDGEVVGGAPSQRSTRRPQARQQRPAYRPTGQTLDELRAVTTGPRAPSLWEQATGIVRGAPSGLAQFIGDVGVTARNLPGEVIDEVTGTGSGFNLNQLPALEDLKESYQQTIHRVTNPTEYLRAIEEGRILGTVLEDVGNVALVGGAASRAASLGARATGAGLARGAVARGGAEGVREAAARVAARQAGRVEARAVRGLEREAARSARTGGRTAARFQNAAEQGYTYSALAEVAGRGAGRARVADTLASTSRNLRTVSRLTDEAADVAFLPYRAAVSGVRRAIPESARARVRQAAGRAVSRTVLNPEVREAREALLTGESFAEQQAQVSSEAFLDALDNIDTEQIRNDGYGAGLDDGQLRRAAASAAMYTRTGDAGNTLPVLGVLARNRLRRPDLDPVEAWRTLDADGKRAVVDEWRARDQVGVGVAERTMDVGMPEGEIIPSEAFVLAMDRAAEVMQGPTAAQLTRFEVQGIEPSQRYVREAFLDPDAAPTMQTRRVRDPQTGEITEVPQEFQPERTRYEGAEREAEYARRQADDRTVGPVEAAVQQDRRLVAARRQAEQARREADRARQRAERAPEPALSEQSLQDRSGRVITEQGRRVELAARRAVQGPNRPALAEAVGLTPDASDARLADATYNAVRSRLRERARSRTTRPGEARPTPLGELPGEAPAHDIIDAVIVEQALTGMLDPELIPDLPALRPVEARAMTLGRGAEAVRTAEQAGRRAESIDVEGARAAEIEARQARVENLRERVQAHVDDAEAEMEVRIEAERQQAIDLADTITVAQDNPAAAVTATFNSPGERRAAFVEAKQAVQQVAADAYTGQVLGKTGAPIQNPLPVMPQYVRASKVRADINSPRPIGGDSYILAWPIRDNRGYATGNYVRVPDTSQWRRLLGADGNPNIDMNAALYDEWQAAAKQNKLGPRQWETALEQNFDLDNLIDEMTDDPADIAGAVESYIEQALTDYALERMSASPAGITGRDLGRAYDVVYDVLADDPDARAYLDSIGEEGMQQRTYERMEANRAEDAERYMAEATRDAERVAAQIDELTIDTQSPWELTPDEYPDWVNDRVAALVEDPDRFDLFESLFFDADGNLIPHGEWVDTAMFAGRQIGARLVDPDAIPGALVDLDGIRDLTTADAATRRLGRAQGRQGEARRLERQSVDRAVNLERQLRDQPRGEARLGAVEQAMRSSLNAYRRAERARTGRIKLEADADRALRKAQRADRRAAGIEARLREDPRLASRRLMPAAQRAYAVVGDTRRKLAEIDNEINLLTQKGSNLNEGQLAALNEQRAVFQAIADEVTGSITEIRERGARRWLPGERDALIELLADPTDADALARAERIVADIEADGELASFGFVQGGDPRQLSTDLSEGTSTFDQVRAAGRSGQEYRSRAESGPTARTPEGVVRLLTQRIRNNIANDVRHHLEQTIGITVEDAIRNPLRRGVKIDADAVNDPAGRLQAAVAAGYAPFSTNKTGLELDDIVVPRQVRDTYAQINREGSNRVLGAVDAFNSRIKPLWLTLSPSWYVGNIVGNTLMGAAEVGLVNYMRALPDAIAALTEYAGEGNLPFKEGTRRNRAARRLARGAIERRNRRIEAFRDDPAVGLENLMRGRGTAFVAGEDLSPRLVRRGMGDLTYETLQGGAMGRRLRRSGIEEQPSGRLSRAGRAVDDRYASFAEGAYRSNNFFDDIGRVATFIAAQQQPWKGGRRNRGEVVWDDDQVYLRGPDADEARNMSLRAVGDFQNMSPWERKAMRRIFSFYPWYKHATRLFFELPLNHPQRVLWTFHLGQVFGEEGEEGGLGGQTPWWLGGTAVVGSGRMRVPGIPFAGPEQLPLVAFDTQDAGLDMIDIRPAFQALSPAITWPVAMFAGFDLSNLEPVSGAPGFEDTVVGDFFGNSELRSLWNDPDALAYWIASQIPLTRTAQRAGMFDALSEIPGVSSIPGMGNLAGDPNVARYDTGEPVMTRTGPIRLERPGAPRQVLDFATGGLTRVIPNEDDELRARRLQRDAETERSRRTYLTRRERSGT